MKNIQEVDEQELCRQSDSVTLCLSLTVTLTAPSDWGGGRGGRVG